jgi:hypothetical protein
MKFAFYTILIILLSFLGSSKCHAQSPQLNSVKIEFEGFDTETVIDVSCEAFDYTFKNTKKVKVFYDEQDLSKFKLFASGFKQTKPQALDVRGVITYNYDKTAIKYCFTVFGSFYSNGKFYYNKDLLIYLSDKVYTRHPKYLDTLRQQ